MEPTARLDRPYLAVVHLMIATLVLLPILAVRVPMLTDYPNHLARIALLARYDVDPWVAATFVQSGRLVPNLAMDLAIPWMIPPLSVRGAGTLFLVGTFLVFHTGTVAVSRALLGRPSYREAILAALFVNSSFLYGFINFSAALAVFLLTFGLWLRWRDRWTALRIITIACLSVIGFLAHLSFMAFMGVAVPAILLWDFRTVGPRFRRDLASVALLFLLLGCFVLARPPGGGPSGWTLNSVGGKAVAAFGQIRSYDVPVDLVLISIGSAVVIGIMLLAKGRQRAYGPALFLGAAFTLAFLAMPRDIFTANAADSRLVPVATLFAALALPALRMGSRRAALLVWLAVSFVVVRQADIFMAWQSVQPMVSSSLALLRNVPDGSRIFVSLNPSSSPDQAKRDLWFRHVPNWESVDRNLIVSTFFADQRQQPLSFRTPPIMCETLAGVSIPPETPRNDYVWGYRLTSTQADSLRRVHASFMGQAGHVTLWHLNCPGQKIR